MKLILKVILIFFKSASGWTGNLGSWTISFSLIFVVGYMLNLATIILKCWILLQ